jgi:hypothetical protein
MTVAFSWLASYVISTSLDQTGLGQWPWIQAGIGEHWTQIVSAYQLCRLSGCRLIGQNGLMKGRVRVAAQHKWYFRKNGNFSKPREVSSTQSITQLRAWLAVGDEIIFFIAVNKNVQTSPLTKALRGNGLNGRADPLFDWERGTTQSLYWEGGNSGHVRHSGNNLHKLIPLSPWCRGWQSSVSAARL